MNMISYEHSLESKSVEDSQKCGGRREDGRPSRPRGGHRKDRKSSQPRGGHREKVNPLNCAAVAVKTVNPPNRVVVIVKSLPNRMVGAVTARRIRLFHARGLALRRNNGTNGRAMGEPTKGKIATNESNLFL